MLPYESNDVLAGFITKHLFQFKFMITVVLTTLLKTLSVVFVKQALILPTTSLSYWNWVSNGSSGTLHNGVPVLLTLSPSWLNSILFHTWLILLWLSLFIYLRCFHEVDLVVYKQNFISQSSGDSEELNQCILGICVCWRLPSCFKDIVWLLCLHIEEGTGDHHVASFINTSLAEAACSFPSCSDLK